MEIKATLNKPYTNKQRMDFIVAENHNKGYEIKETETALEAWGHTEEEQDRFAIESQVAQLEAATGLIRPLRETITAGQIPVSIYVLNKIQEIEDLAQQLREEVQEQEEPVSELLED